MFQTRIGQDQIEIPGIWPSKLEESWTIILADKSFGEDYDYEKGEIGNARFTCIIEFGPVDGDGMAMVVSPCRKPVSK